jgi:hypothetical protein
MPEEKSALRYLRNSRVILVLALIIVFFGATIYGVMSDTSVHSLTTKIFYASRYCTTPSGSSQKKVTFSLSTSVWSSASIHTSITQASFSLQVDGMGIGTLSAPDGSWDPGKGAPYQLIFSTVALNPLSLPSSSSLVLSVTGQVSAGIITDQVTTSDSSVQNFGSSSC